MDDKYYVVISIIVLILIIAVDDVRIMHWKSKADTGRCAVEYWKSQADEYKQAIKVHRSQRLDDRCWIDDYDLYAVLGDEPHEVDTRLPPKEEFMQNCARFHECRQLTATPEEAVKLYKKERT